MLIQVIYARSRALKKKIPFLDSCRPDIACLLMILLAGTALRFYHLGHNSYWLDEAGVAFAARAATLPDMLKIVRSHVLAMPLDYLVVWLFGRFSFQEAVLRIPAALWGSLSLLLAYRFFRKFTGVGPSLLGLLVLALSPLHIQYSQELRFYASLVFFYLLSSLLLWGAIQHPSRRSWVLFTAATILGIYFHPYVFFALANGLVWLVLSPPNGQPVKPLRMQFLTSVTVCLLAFLAGYLAFSASNQFQIPLMVFEQSPAGAVASGMGWLPFSAVTLNAVSSLSLVWGALCAALEIGGIVATLKRQLRSPLSGLFFSFLLQLSAVLGSDILGHYFFAPRQLLILLPILCLFAGIGAQVCIAGITRWLGKIPPVHSPAIWPARWQKIVTILAVCAILLASLPAIALYEQDDKGNSRAISQMIMEQWQPGDSILVTPGYDGFVYKYYIEQEFGRPDVSARLWIVNWDEIQATGGWTGNLFLITPSTLTPMERNQLRSLDLAPYFQSQPNSRYAKTLWIRVNIQP
jgi:4-amino-4-deoxy-L-arabinose transferase-like glycosyltransferase